MNSENQKNGFILATILASLPMSSQMVIGLAAFISSYNIMVFTSTIMVPTLQMCA